MPRISPGIVRNFLQAVVLRHTPQGQRDMATQALTCAAGRTVVLATPFSTTRAIDLEGITLTSSTCDTVGNCVRLGFVLPPPLNFSAISFEQG